MLRQPDIVLIMADDMGFSDLGCYGGEIDTPTLDRLARSGTRMTQFYTTPRCSPSRASLMTGLHPHQVGVGILDSDHGAEGGYPGRLSEDCVTLPEALKGAGYATFMSGKWHLSNSRPEPEPDETWPTRRGFDKYFGASRCLSYFQPDALFRGEQNIDHEALDEDFYITDAITDNALSFIQGHHRDRGDEPFFLYLPYTAPHWPLHAHADDVAKYHGRFDKGWERLREERLQRQVEDGLLPPDSRLSDLDPEVPSWDSVEDSAWEARRMEVYAAQVERMDHGIGRVIAQLEQLGRLDNTIVIFLSDNGGCAEDLSEQSAAATLRAGGWGELTTRDGEPMVLGNQPGVMPGPESTFQSYGRSWANLSNTPFREYKHWVHEGGISTPFIIHWPAGLVGDGNGDANGQGQVTASPAHIVDVVPTLLEAAGAAHPGERDGRAVPALEGRSILPMLHGGEPDPQRTYFWEHEGNCAVRRGRWKLVKKYGQDWELYDIDADRSERDDVAEHHPDIVSSYSADYAAWASRCGVLPYETTLEIYRRVGAL